MLSFFSAGQGACLCLINTLMAKLYMSFFWRLRMVFSGGRQNMKRILDSPDFKVAHRYQLNEAEWAPIFVSSLLFAHSQNIDVNLAATLATCGSVWYFWAGVSFGFPMHVPGAVLRYAGLISLVHQFYNYLM